MTKNIRLNVFETNSSSSHAISITDDPKGIYDTLPVNDDGSIVLTGGEFGWEWRKYNDALTKANYAAVFSGGGGKMRSMLVDVIKEHTGAKDVLFTYGDFSYIDHQSGPGEGGEAHKAFESKETLTDFIFSPDSWLFTGNDNEPAPPNFYDVGEIRYTHILDLDGIKEYLPSYPNDEELQEKLDTLVRHHHLISGYSASYYQVCYGGERAGKEDSFAKIKEGVITLFKYKSLYDGSKYIGREVIDAKDIPFSIKEA